MDLMVALVVFLSAVAVCIGRNISLVAALLVGFFAFFLVGLHRGYQAKQLLSMSVAGVKTAISVQKIMVLIGLLTALWRCSGTIAFFVRGGIELITPTSFVMIAFLLPAVLCLAFGSSFGVAGTAGVILMTIARSGGANLVVTAGAVISGAYVGERLSSASSAIALVAAMTGVDQRDLQRRMWRNTPLPMVLTLVIYGVLSVSFPIQSVDGQILDALGESFRLSWPTILPAIVLVILPWFKISASRSILISCILAAGVALFVQKMPLSQLLYAGVMGHTVEQSQLKDILSGGGIVSMVPVILIIFLSCAYSGLFNGTGMLKPYQRLAGKLADRVGLFPAQVVVSLFCAGLFCNQAVTIVMGSEFLREHYKKQDCEPMEMAANVGDAALHLPGMVPWCIACSVPLATIGSGMEAIPFAVYLYLVPLCHWLTCRPAGKVTK